MPGGRQSTKRLSGLPLLPAATDLAANIPVTIATVGGAWGVLPVETNSQGPVIGINRASAPAGTNVGADIQDMKEVRHITAAASIAQGAFVGAVSANIVTTVGSNKIVIPQIGEVAKASASNRYAIGQALESAAPGTEFAYYFDPRQLSGLI